MYLAGVNEFMLALSVAQKDGARLWVNFHLQTIFFALAQLRLTGSPRQIVGLDGLKFVSDTPPPHTFARLHAANPVIQISFPRCYKTLITGICWKMMLSLTGCVVSNALLLLAGTEHYGLHS